YRCLRSKHSGSRPPLLPTDRSDSLAFVRSFLSSATDNSFYHRGKGPQLPPRLTYTSEASSIHDIVVRSFRRCCLLSAASTAIVVVIRNFIVATIIRSFLYNCCCHS
ncbi:hypothetical protein BHE74_00045753, partial [Ensete ventricosum]